MTPNDLIAELRSRINPDYAATRGTESYERRLCVEALERTLKERDYLAEGMRDVFPAAHRLALELECLLLDTKDTAAVSKWWDSAHEALEQWREFCREDAELHNVEVSGLRGLSRRSARLPGYAAWAQ